MSREEAIEYLHRLFIKAELTDEYGDMDDTEPYETAVNMAVNALKEQKTGKWISVLSYNNTYKCSECERLLVNIPDGKNKVAQHYPYCHCGAKMEVEEE